MAEYQYIETRREAATLVATPNNPPLMKRYLQSEERLDQQ